MRWSPRAMNTTCAAAVPEGEGTARCARKSAQPAWRMAANRRRPPRTGCVVLCNSQRRLWAQIVFGSLLMSPPRIVVAGATTALTRRTTLRKAFLAPWHPMVADCWLYSLADAQRETGVAVHFSGLFITHHHTDVGGTARCARTPSNPRRVGMPRKSHLASGRAADLKLQESARTGRVGCANLSPGSHRVGHECHACRPSTSTDGTRSPVALPWHTVCCSAATGWARHPILAVGRNHAYVYFACDGRFGPCWL
jgi:hypothetical protein